jgi:hypothetical protein
MTTATEDSFRLVHSFEPQNHAWIVGRFRDEAPRLLLSTLQHAEGQKVAHDCMLTDVGTYLITMLQVLSTFACELVDRDIADHLTSRAEDLLDEDDLTTLGRLDDKHAILREINRVLLEANQKCLSAWRGCPELPAWSASAENAGATTELSPLQARNVAQPSSTSEHNLDIDNDIGDNKQLSSSSSPSVHTDFERASTEVVPRVATPEVVMGSRSTPLTKRGIGKYYCPYGLSCDKGGVMSPGTMKEFNRNSDFR